MSTTFRPDVMRLAWVVWAALILSACAGTPVQEDVSRLPRERIAQFELAGRVAIRQAQRADTVRMQWQHGPGHDVIAFASPLGNTLAELRRDVSGARWVAANGERYEAASADELMARLTEQPVPIQSLSLWVLGRVSDNATRVERDAVGRLMSAEDGGWRVSVVSYESARAEALPAVVEAERPGLRLRLAIESWQL